MFFSDHGGVQWLVVFLGNPGLKYQNTRHNAGFLTADVVEKDCGVHIDRLRFHALTAQAELGGQKVLLMKPQTFMNNSGEAVAPAAKFYKVLSLPRAQFAYYSPKSPEKQPPLRT